jgi:hypothetical protein
MGALLVVASTINQWHGVCLQATIAIAIVGFRQIHLLVRLTTLW